MKPLTIVLACCLLFAAGCAKEEPAPSTTPEPPGPAVMSAKPEDAAKAALAAMLALAEKGDWAAYVDTFYGEKAKFTSPADQAKLVARFADGWGAKVTEALKAASDVTPRLEDGRAIFEVDGKAVFVLHEGEGGAWTFHL